MTNVLKYLTILESLEFPSLEEESQVEQLRIESNLGKLKISNNKAIDELLIELSEIYEFHDLIKNSSCTFDVEGEYSVLLISVMQQVIRNTNFESDAKEDLISSKHTNLCIRAIQDISTNSVRINLYPILYDCGVFGTNKLKNTEPNYILLSIAIYFLKNVLQIKQFHISNSMELVVRDYMAGIYSLFIAKELHKFTLSEEMSRCLENMLNSIWRDISKVEFFRNILLLKSIRNLPLKTKQQLHMSLIQKLGAQDGFAALVATLQTAQRQNETNKCNEKQIFEVIANIAAHKGHTRKFQQSIIEEIFKFIDACLRNEAMADSMGAGLLTLRKLYNLREENQLHIKNKLHSSLINLIQPIDMLTGLILMEHAEFCITISRLYHLFCTSVVECLPSELLIVYQPLLLQLYYNIPRKLKQRKQISALITRCLNNRSKQELKHIIQCLYKYEKGAGHHYLHERLIFSCNIQRTEVTFKVGPDNLKQDFNISLALPELLMTEEFHMLTYEIFMILLELITQSLKEDHDDANLEFIQTEDDLISFLNRKYPTKVEVLLTLNTLISHQPLRQQISSNTNHFLQFLRKLIINRLEKSTSDMESTDEVLLIMLTLAYEILQHSELAENFQDMLPYLRKLHNKSPNKLVQQRLNALVTLLTGDLKSENTVDTSAYQTARSLIESNESYLQVYGIQMLLGLLRRRDPAVLANGHVIIALALTTLKDKESYTFLNCVRLFVGLVYVLEAEVFEVLSGEYLNENALMDYRLVVGEAILKVSNEIGPLCYRYKDVLLNCFMYGVRSPLDEYRMSSFANLSQICRILSYQVHNFFNELLNIINSELENGKYIPSKRAAVMVLSELFMGIDNLLDFEEMLLPSYRLLKWIESDVNFDEKMRIHAANGLKTLAEKCRKFLFPEQLLQKDIKILDIKDTSNKKTSNKHILEII